MISYSASLIVFRIVLFAVVFLTVPFLPGSLCRRLTPQLLRGILCLVLRFKHTERLNKASPVMVMNHIHDYDTYLIPMLAPDTRPLISDHTTKIPILGAIIKRGYAPWAPLWVRSFVLSTDLTLHIGSTTSGER